ncbi:MAG: hypothetical protein Q9184_006654 [Pyrenodesmia sp. 2 TL-2023]
MSSIVHLVRHAEALHNTNSAHWTTHDPPLTPFGKQQCRELRARFPHHSSIGLLVTSPLCRTIQTTLSAFHPEVSRGVKCVALPELQETGSGTCDTGSGAFVLKQAFKNTPIDFNLVTNDWASNKGRWAHEDKAIEARCQVVLRWLKSREEDEIVVVSHAGLLRRLTDKKCSCGKYHGPSWKNAEFRSYSIAEFRPDCTVDGTGSRLGLVEETAELRQLRVEMSALLENSEEKDPDDRKEKEENGAESGGGTAFTRKPAGLLSSLWNGSRSAGVSISRMDLTVLIYVAAVILVLLPFVAGGREQQDNTPRIES